MARQRALLAAIDHYPNPANNLPSCLADMKAFERMLRGAFGFTETRMLADGEASLANVQAGLDWLFAGATPEDRLVFYFSGHGYQVRRGDNLDEVLCLYDKFLVDNELSERTKDIPPGIFSMISDSCHSGGMYKILMPHSDSESPVVVAQTKVLRVPPPEEEEKAFVSAADVRSLRYRPFGFRRPTLAAAAKVFNMSLPKGFDEGGDLAMNGLLLSACQENETASASTARTDGKSAFTYALLQQIEKLGPGISNAKLVDGVTKALNDLGFRQTPVMVEPPAPSGLASRSFLMLDEEKAVSTGESEASGLALSRSELSQIIARAVDNIRSGSPAAPAPMP